MIVMGKFRRIYTVEHQARPLSMCKKTRISCTHIAEAVIEDVPAVNITRRCMNILRVWRERGRFGGEIWRKCWDLGQVRIVRSRLIIIEVGESLAVYCTKESMIRLQIVSVIRLGASCF